MKTNLQYHNAASVLREDTGMDARTIQSGMGYRTCKRVIIL